MRSTCVGVGVSTGSSLDTSLPASTGGERQSRQDEAMGLKLSLPALKVRRSLTVAGRKLPNREDWCMMASEMSGCCLPRIIAQMSSSPWFPSATGSPSASGKSEPQ